MKNTCKNPWFDQKFLVHLRSFSEIKVNPLMPTGLAGWAVFSQKSYSAEKQAVAAHSIRTGIKTGHCWRRIRRGTAATYSIRTGIKTFRYTCTCECCSYRRAFHQNKDLINA